MSPSGGMSQPLTSTVVVVKLHPSLYVQLDHFKLAIIMIRLPPTSITLTPADLRDFYRRRWRPEMLVGQYGLTNAPDASNNRWSGTLPTHLAADKESDEKQSRILGHGPPQNDGTVTTASDNEGPNSHHRRSQLESRLALYQSRETTSTSDSAPSEDERDYQPVRYARNIPSALSSSSSDENTDYQATPQMFSSIREDFRYGGFTETTRAQKSERQDPEDTGLYLQLPEQQQPGARATLPRSPLFISQNMSSSPDNSRTPSTAQQSSTPSVLFSQPPRRTPGIIFGSFEPTPRRPQRTFRHQTNSFSLDSDERASAVYEQDRISSASSSDDGPLSAMRSLREELRNSSLGSSSIISTASIANSELRGDRNEKITPSRHETSLSDGRRLNSSSSLLSAEEPDHTPVAGRSAASVGVEPQNLNANDVRTSVPNDSRRQQASASRISTRQRNEVQSSSSASYSGASSSRRGHRFLNFQRERMANSNYDTSPEHPSPSPTSSPSSTVHASSPYRGTQTVTPQPRTPSSNYRVYNDSLPSSSQPQTPAHLAEARHQSRYHPSYTAPVARNRSRLGSAVTGHGSRTGRGLPFNIIAIDRSRSRPASQARTRHSRRDDSPTGLETEGFQGLYGGRENGDDEANYFEGVQFDGASRRLWQARDRDRHT